MRRRLLPAAAALVALLAGTSEAHACACCADRATWREDTAPLMAFERSELARLRFAPKAFDVPSPQGLNRSYAVSGTLRGSRWRVRLSGLPALTLSAPARATTFVADLRDGVSSGGGGPLLYKELRLRGTASGPGTRYRLILQGRGNNCLQAGDFKHWRLEVTGGKRKLTVYGDFVRPGA